jgi:hypothetical protein
MTLEGATCCHPLSSTSYKNPPSGWNNCKTISSPTWNFYPGRAEGPQQLVCDRGKLGDKRIFEAFLALDFSRLYAVCLWTCCMSLLQRQSTAVHLCWATGQSEPSWSRAYFHVTKQMVSPFHWILGRSHSLLSLLVGWDKFLASETQETLTCNSGGGQREGK